MDENLPCPLCGCDDLDVRSLAMCDEELLVHGLMDEANAVGCIDMVECVGCFAQAPASRWNRRPDPWRYPPDLPADGQRILYTYQAPAGESKPITGVYTAEHQNTYCHPMVRWMPVPEAS